MPRLGARLKPFRSGRELNVDPAAHLDLRDQHRREPELANPAADESTTGTAYLMLTDPDGNPILIDQHVPSPKK